MSLEIEIPIAKEMQRSIKEWWDEKFFAVEGFDFDKDPPPPGWEFQGKDKIVFVGEEE